MGLSLRNLGFYNPEVTYDFDTAYAKKKQERVTINYHVDVGKRTRIDTVAYIFDQPELEKLALATKKESFLFVQFVGPIALALDLKKKKKHVLIKKEKKTV